MTIHRVRDPFLPRQTDLDIPSSEKPFGTDPGEASIGIQSEPMVAPATQGSGSGEIPSPFESQNLERLLEEKTSQLDQLHSLQSDLQTLAQAGDAEAQRLLQEFDRAISTLEGEIAELEVEISSDLDSDGIPDIADPDRDGDALTNDREARDGTNPDSADTDGDGISDDNEIRLRNLGRMLGDLALERRGDPLRADADQDGIIDSAQLTTQIRSQIGLGSASDASGGGGSSSGGSLGVESTGSTPPPAQWGAPPTDATSLTLEPGRGPLQLPSGSGTFVIQTPDEGRVLVSQQGNILRAELETDDGSQLLLIPNADAKRIFFEGGSEVVFVNFDPSEFLSVNSYGYAETGIHTSSTTNVLNVVSPFDRVLEPADEEVVNGVTEITYELDDLSQNLTFKTLGQIDGQEATQWTVDRDGNDLVIEAKNRSGQALKRFRLSEGFRVKDFLTLQMDDIGQRLDSKVDLTIRGGAGDDMIYSVAGEKSQIFGEGGRDTIFVDGNQSGSLIEGGAGDDIIRGSDGSDRLEGGDGNDFIYGGAGEENRLSGGAGNDALFSAHTMADTGQGEIVLGGTGLDLTNAYTGHVAEIETGIADLNGLQTYLVQYAGEGATPIELSEMLNAEEFNIPYARQLVAEGLKKVAIDYLIVKEAERQGAYGPLLSGEEFTPPQVTSPSPPEEGEDSFLGNFLS